MLFINVFLKHEPEKVFLWLMKKETPTTTTTQQQIINSTL
jgi:hypothetical protein